MSEIKNTEGIKQEIKDGDNLCSYIFSSGERCTEPRYQNNSHCFWHNHHAKKDDIDIKVQLEEKARNKESMEGYELAHTNLEDIYLIGADLRGANLKRANLSGGHLYNINLSRANLFKADLNNANLRDANLEGAELLGANLDGAILERIKWGKNCIIKSEIEAGIKKSEGKKHQARERYLESEEIYRNIKNNFKNRGLSSEGGVFFHREMIMKRKQMPLFSMKRFWSKMADLTCGYGESPFRIITFSLVFIIINAFIFCFLGLSGGKEILHLSINRSLFENLCVIYNAIYFSVITFTTTGYGDYTSIGLGKMFATIEAYMGAFLMSLFVIAVYKNTMER